MYHKSVMIKGGSLLMHYEHGKRPANTVLNRPGIRGGWLGQVVSAPRQAAP